MRLNCQHRKGRASCVGLCLWTILSFLMPTVPAKCLDPTKAITQYVHDSWDTDRGLPQMTITSITRTTEGYLWLATEEGLVRFDGVSFTVFDKRSTPALRSNNIR
ncbi:MAG: hypothetical protein ABSF46_27720, partial [Terriglobia bacterium]